MKTEMRVKSESGTLFGERKHAVSGAEQAKRTGSGLPAGRMLACTALLVLLGVGGYIGAGRETTQTAAAPVAQRTVLEHEYSAMTYDEILLRHTQDREREIGLLDSVIEHPQTEDAVRKDALAQKMQLAARMEEEAKIRAALAYIGFNESAALCGAQQITVIVEDESAKEKSVQIIDAVSGVADVQPQDVKIILVKK